MTEDLQEPHKLKIVASAIYTMSNHYAILSHQISAELCRNVFFFFFFFFFVIPLTVFIWSTEIIQEPVYVLHLIT